MNEFDKKMTKELLTKKAEILKAIAHPARLCILAKLLSEGKCNVSNLQCCIDIPQSTISQHLAKLRALKIVNYERKGLEIYYSISNSDAEKIINLFLEDTNNSE